MEIIKGNLIKLALAGRFDYIMHGCNCFCAMGAGIALQIAQTFPEAYNEDKGTRKGDLFKLGNYSKTAIKLSKGIVTPSGNNYVTVVNLYTQYKPGSDFKEFALMSSLYKFYIKEMLAPSDKIGVPWIGCGIGGGDQVEVKKIFEKFDNLLDLTVVEFDTASKPIRRLS
jgi:O-acetyl-ADP-ribose deacetylase (regulator of RNase III)